ncbi:MAG: Crp/Fnr family transcriptional regulator [Christensenellales bacterium]|jgi:CRP-like cAMP-binding protein
MEIPLFCGIDEAEQQKLMACLGAQERFFPKHRTIFRAGDAADRIGIVLSGSALIEQDDSNGERHIASVVLPGEIFGEVFALSLRDALPVHIVAREDATILLMDGRKILSPCANACRCHMHLLTNLLQAISRRALEMYKKAEILSQKSTRDKIMTYLQYEMERVGTNHFSIPFDRQSLADYLSVERSAMSSEIWKLCRAGAISVNRSEFTVHRPLFPIGRRGA